MLRSECVEVFGCGVRRKRKGNICVGLWEEVVEMRVQRVEQAPQK